MLSLKEKIKKELLENLNPNQKIAVQHRQGPLLIFAGAGSGKTRVITHRIAYLIRIYEVPPESILAVTFTNKAAEEMKERVQKLIGPYSERVTIKTFHGLGLQILRENYGKLNLKSNFSVYDQASQKSLAKRISKTLKLEASDFTIGQLLEKIHRARDDYLNPDEYYEQNLNNHQIDVVYQFYKEYINELRANNAVDFGDLLYESVKLLENYPELLEEYQARWKYLMIDEYQDTNKVQYLLVMMISKKHQNIAVVGDDDQCIYSWRGAKIENIWNFQKDFPQAKIVKLEENYRSTQQILDLANKLIRYNQRRIEKKLHTKSEGVKPVFFSGLNEHDEIQKIVFEIQKLKSQCPLDEMAIFYRTNAQSRIIEQVLRENRISYVIHSGIRFFDRKEIKDILSYLQFLYNPYDFDSFVRMIENPPKGIGEKTVEKIQEYAKKHNSDYLLAVEKILEEKVIKNPKKLLEFKEKLYAWKEKVDKVALSDFVKTIVEESGVIAYYEKDLSPEGSSRIENIREFIQSVVEYEQKKREANQEITLRDYLQEIALLSSEEVNFDEHHQKGIQLMTLHNAKGLEFEIVFIVGLAEGIFPHYLSTSEEEIEEERRLLYVGMTRAKKRLYLSYAKTRDRYEQVETNQPSRFLIEMELLPKEETITKSDFEEVEEPEGKENKEYRIGDFFLHEKYGIGRLENLEEVAGKVILTLKFQNGSKKRFLADHYSIRKI
ncbi:MAG: UvrD-helicase domain-containing protein [Leptospiraceae bacterium]|nr:UvrD-helicase domain-containing protein [Leptospiraceae bacterium]MDW7976384.1 3'-5' exonuclease [Leptospiraceae bacterium]